MTPERWTRVQAVFEAALEQPAAARDAFVQDACGSDTALRQEVLSLLLADAKTGAVLDEPVVVPGLPAGQRGNDEPLPAGTQLGEYVIEGEIGAGGFGRVYRAIHPVIRKPAAIKVLHPRYSASQDHATRFVNEARTVNEIGHPDIIDVFAFGKTDDGSLYFVMELVQAPTLEERLRRDGPFPLARALPILRRLAAAVDAAHAHGVVHRDLKPANVLLVTGVDGATQPKLLDFGIAKLGESTIVPDQGAPDRRTAEGQILGTPAYMSPEQARGLAVDAATDIYALGVLTYEMLTGQVPFRGATPLDTLMLHVGEAAVPPSQRIAGLSPAVDEATLAMLAKDPTARPATCAEAIARLQAALPRPPVQGGRARVVASAAVAGAVVIAAIVGWRGLGAPDPAPQMPVADTRPKPVPADEPTERTLAPAPHVVAPTPVQTPPATCRIEIVGPPPGTEVLDTANAVLGTAPGTVALPCTSDAVVLLLRRAGYRDARRTVTPDQDQPLEVTLQRKSKSRLNPDLESPFAP